MHSIQASESHNDEALETREKRNSRLVRQRRGEHGGWGLIRLGLVLSRVDGCLASSAISCLINVQILRHERSRFQGPESATFTVILAKWQGSFFRSAYWNSLKPSAPLLGRTLTLSSRR